MIRKRLGGGGGGELAALASSFDDDDDDDGADDVWLVSVCVCVSVVWLVARLVGFLV